MQYMTFSIRRQHPLAPLHTLALQRSQLCLCLHRQRQPLPGLLTGRALHESGSSYTLNPVAPGHPCLHPRRPHPHAGLMVKMQAALCTLQQALVSLLSMLMSTGCRKIVHACSVCW